MNKKISEMVKRGKTIFKSKIKWILALILLTGCIYGSYTLSRAIFTSKSYFIFFLYVELTTRYDQAFAYRRNHQAIAVCVSCFL